MPEPKLVALDHPVALLDEHLLTDEEGNEICYLSPEKLQTIADNNNRRVEVSGDESPIVVGHTEDGRPEKEQGELIGFARDFFVSKGKRQGERVVPARDGDKHYLFSKWRVYEDDLPLLRKFPRRSVELWTSRWEIDPIAVLGATTPDRDLGLVRCSRGEKGHSVKIRFMEHSPTMMSYDSGPDLGQQDPMLDLNPEGGDSSYEEQTNQPITLAQLEQLDWVQFIKQLMMNTEEGVHGGGLPGEQEEEQYWNEMGPDGDQGSAGGQGPNEELEPTTDGEGSLGHDGEFDSEEEPLADEQPLRHAAGYGGSTNTFVPGMVQMNRQIPQGRRPAAAPTHPDLVRLARVENAAVALADENRQLRIRLARAERRADLAQLEAEGVELDINEELDIVCPETGEPLDQARYENYLNKMRKRFRRSPVVGQGQQPIYAQIGTTGEQPVRGRRQESDVVRKQRVDQVLRNLEKNPSLDYDAELEKAYSRPTQGQVEKVQ
jgi:hypothetical protein